MPHVDDGTLHALLDGALRAHEPDRADRVEAHLDACADCRARLQEAAALRDRAADVLADLDPGLAPDAAADRTGAADRKPGATAPAPEPVPDFQEVRARAAGAAGAGNRDPGLRRRFAWTRGLAWAATIVVALGTGYLVRDLADPAGVVPRAASMEQADRAETGGRQPTADAAEGAGPAPAAPTAEQEQERPDLSTELEPTEAGESPAAGEVESAPKMAQDEALEAAPPAEAADVFAPAPAAAARGEAAALDSAAAREWRAVAVAEAEAGAGPLLVLPGATIATAELADDGSVRTRQRLPDDVEVVVVQAISEEVVVQEDVPVAVGGDPVDDAHQAALRDEPGQERIRLRTVQAMTPSEAVPTLMGLDLDSAAAATGAPVTVTVLRDGRSLTLTAPLPEDVLLALAATAAPRTP